MRAQQEGQQRQISWINHRQNPINPQQKPLTCEQMAQGCHEPSIESLAFRDHNSFLAGELHRHHLEWEHIIKANASSEQAAQCLDWIKLGVNIDDFMRQFKGEFQGDSYDDHLPPPRIFTNSPSTKALSNFVSNTLMERIRAGSVRVWGKVGEVAPPHVVSPLTVEPTKPRLCINMQYINCWMKDTPFTLDSLVDIPRIASEGSHMSKLDDKSGYDHVMMTENSLTLLGFEWEGWYFVAKTLPFGWKNSAFIYHTLNLQAVSYLRQLKVAILLYIDDRWVEQWKGMLRLPYQSPAESKLRARMAIYMAAELFTRLGYFLGLNKSVLDPVTDIIFLGMGVNTLQLAFYLPAPKKADFATLRDSILLQESVPLNTLQRFTGKCVSFLLAIPGAKLYTSEANMAISRAIRSHTPVRITETLKNEIKSWEFLDFWEGVSTWRPEYHCTLHIATDSSDYRWGV